MREEKAVSRLLRKLADLIVEESEANEAFAQRLRAVLSEVSPSASSRPQKAPDSPKPALPDVHAELASLGESEFRLWLLGQSREVLKAIIRSEDIDPTRRTAKWKDVDKLADYIADSIRSRQQRGASFLNAGSP